MNRRPRVVLLIAYLCSSFLLAWMLEPGPGVLHCLLGSWGFMMGMVILGLFLDLGQTVVVLVVLLSFALYLLGLLLLNNVLSRAFRFPIPIISLSIHSVGFFLCLISWPSLDSFPSAIVLIPTVVLILAYFILDWQLALRSRGARLMIGGNGQLQVK
jgi:hypothetical protein